MIYILETNLSERQLICFSLTQIFGIGQFQSFQICKKLGLASNCRLSDLTPEQITRLIKLIEGLNLSINNNLRKSKIILAKKLIQIKSYRGIRRLRGLPVRGQRTHTNAKTSAKFR